MVQAPPKPLPREAMADTFDAPDCNTGMSLAYAVAWAAAEAVFSTLYTAPACRFPESREIAYDIAFRLRHECTLPQIVEYATERALNTVPETRTTSQRPN